MPGATASRARGWHAITRPDPCNFFNTFRSHRADPSSPGLSWGFLGSPGLSWVFFGFEIVQVACQKTEPRAREDVVRSRVRTPANFCIRFARTGRLQALLGSHGALQGLSQALLGLSWVLKSSKWHAGCRSPARARMSCDHASGPLQTSAYVSLPQGVSKLSWAFLGLSWSSPWALLGSPGLRSERSRALD
jgi:hypothetical protein